MPELSLSEEFGRLVREWRTQRGYSQEGFAYRCGIHRTYMTHIELGSKMPSIHVVARIARGFEIELSELFRVLEERGVTVARVTDEPTVR
ncbi:MAG: helix-turn-helix transcriptional regulator [Fimbriimonadaceae bacterium]|nr:helix-turn-helix transcriptional regulator [Fimbriimonadaceae bacterium]QYK58059.1 MAG: helix-turn-helix transcriptional regulator [Fimbriimonadaceae bacterium]HAP40480.1 transcriptional regulator [Nitrospira sp.]